MVNPMLGDPFDTSVDRRRREVTAQVDDLRDRALALERRAVSGRQTTLRSVGSYAQVMASVEADGMEKEALRMRRRAAELEHEMERI